MTAIRVSDVVRAIADAFPVERAESWDKVGLLAGDPAAVVTGVALALDPTLAAIAAAAEGGANVLVTHHPAFLDPPATITASPGAGGIVHAAVERGVALVNAHTNLDRDEDAQRLLPALLGLSPRRPLERSSQPMSVITVFVPEHSATDVIDAMAEAGAGRVGRYDRCAFTAAGTGTFTPRADAEPVVGSPGAAEQVPEVRIESFCPASRADAVVAAAVRAHPYEEPLVTVTASSVARNAAALGMLCGTAALMTLGDLAAQAGAVFGITPRVWGDADASVTKVATATGSAGSLIRAARMAGADALIAGEVRYHDAVDAVASGLAVIEVGHDVSEWPLVSLLERAVLGVPGIDAESVFMLPSEPGWWTP